MPSRCGSQLLTLLCQIPFPQNDSHPPQLKAGDPFLSWDCEFLDAKLQQKWAGHAPFNHPSGEGIWSWGKGTEKCQLGGRGPHGTESEGGSYRPEGVGDRQ